MGKEKIRFKVDSLLLGERQLSRLVVLVPQVLKILSFVLVVLAVPQVRVLYYSFPALGVIYVIVAIMLRILIWCAELFRDRWFVCRIKGLKIKAAVLLARFSFRDVLRAGELALVSRLYYLGRGLPFFAVPLLCLAVSVWFVYSGVSSTVLFTLVCGNLLLFAAAGVFCSAALCTVRYAVKLTSLEKSGAFGAVREKISALDSSGFRLLRLRTLNAGTFSSERIMAALLYSADVIC